MIPPEHGGDLSRAIERYRIAAADWLDLSAAINPMPYRPPALPARYMHQLPEAMAAMLDAAQRYYADGAPAVSVVAAPGSQALIQWLPLLRPRCRVAVPHVGYREHAFRWHWAGHEVLEYAADDMHGIDALLARETIDVLVVINPNNPLGTLVPRARLQQWLELLQRRRGWLIVDEAFVDAQPEHSMAEAAAQPGLIVLRSLGKFFGLAGLRCGFALCTPALAQQLQVALGPWPLSGPALWGALHALQDGAWQLAARRQLRATSAACGTLLQHTVDTAEVLRSSLFNSVVLPAAQATAVQEGLAQQGVWIRRVALNAQRELLRFGLVLPDSAAAVRLHGALAQTVESLSAQRFSIT
jgi:cobalamin biosynthesis protein CobC